MKLSPLVFWGTALAEQSQLICTTGLIAKCKIAYNCCISYFEFFATINQPLI